MAHRVEAAVSGDEAADLLEACARTLIAAGWSRWIGTNPSPTSIAESTHRSIRSPSDPATGSETLPVPVTCAAPGRIT